jgi:hypothetical protein
MKELSMKMKEPWIGVLSKHYFDGEREIHVVYIPRWFIVQFDNAKNEFDNLAVFGAYGGDYYGALLKAQKFVLDYCGGVGKLVKSPDSNSGECEGSIPSTPTK